MKIRLITLGKTTEPYVREGIEHYVKRLQHYIDFSIFEIDEIKGSKKITLYDYRKKEAEKLMPHLKAEIIVLLDEKGKQMTSFEYARFLQEKMIHSTSSIDFVVGGPFGFDESVRSRATMQLSFSQFTFPHQMIRLFFVEQLYRAMTIIKGEKYHHE